MFLKSKYYPVNFDDKVIYDDPAQREYDCTYGRVYNDKGTIGIKGARLNEYECYKQFTVIKPGA